MNFIIDLPSFKLRKNVFDFVLIIMHKYTRLLTNMFINRTIIVLQLEEIIFKHIFQDFGILKSIVLNRSSIFINYFWFNVMFHLKIEYEFITTFYLQTNG